MTKLEEVARAIHVADGGLNWETLSKPSKDLHRLWARAAIAAMREPTGGMLSIACGQEVTEREKIRKAHHAMIDAVLRNNL